MHEASEAYCAGSGFCQELSGSSDTDFQSIYDGKPPSRLIANTSNLSLIADMSPLCVGHLLLASNNHYLSFAEVMNHHEVELKDALEQIFGQYKSTFGNPLILEHGSVHGMDGSSCITHAHLHLLPISLDAAHKVMVGDGLIPTEIGGIEALGAIATQGVPYFYGADQHRNILYGVSRSMRRQYLRSVAGALLGIPDPEWDYALVVRKDLLRITMAAVASWCVK